MNEIQRKVLIAVGVAIFLMFAYAPYVVHGYGSSSSAIIDSGYAFIGDLPDRATVNIGTLIIEWVGACLLGGLAFLYFKDKE